MGELERKKSRPRPFSTSILGLGLRSTKLMTTVTVVLPVRNEEEYIRPCLESLLDQHYPGHDYEIIVVDGRSSDCTSDIVEEIRLENPQVRLLSNPAGIVPTAMNMGILSAHGQVIIRADGHTTYPPNYIADCVRYLESTGADNVGGPCATVPRSECFSARVVAALLSNPFGVGDSRFRIGDHEGYVDTVPFGAFRRELFDRIGLYNERLVRNQDNELNARIRRMGGKIYQTPKLKVQYHPPESFAGLLWQTLRNSQWHIFTLRENRGSLGPRHLLPAAFVVGLLLLLGTGGYFPTARFMLLAELAVYVILGLYCAARWSYRFGWPVIAAMPVAGFCFHVTYGLGTLAGLVYLFKSPTARPLRPGLPIDRC